MSNNTNGQQLLAVVSAGAHESASKALHDGALMEMKEELQSEMCFMRPTQQFPCLSYVSLLESLSLVSASSVGNEGGVLSLDGNEILKRDYKTSETILELAEPATSLLQFFSYHKGQITDFDVLKGPLSEKLDGGSRLSHGVYMCEGVTGALCFAATLLALWVIICVYSQIVSFITKTASKPLKPTKAVCVATEIVIKTYVQFVTVFI